MQLNHAIARFLVASFVAAYLLGFSYNASQAMSPPPNPANAALLEAARRGNIDRIRLAQSDGADINERDEYGATPLIYALLYEHPEAAKYLIDAGADPNLRLKDKGWMPLHEYHPTYHATPGGEPASQREQGLVGQTPLLLAAQSGYSDIVQLLISRGAADVGDSTDRARALRAAAGAGDARSVELLLDQGTLADARHLIHSASAFAGLGENTALHAAASSNRPEIVTLLLARGANCNALGFANQTPLYAAIDHGALGAVRVLVKCADLDDASRADTPLQLAAHRGQEEICEVLLDNGADPNKVAGAGQNSALMNAIVRGHPAIAAMLITRGADVNYRNAESRTALIEAAEKGTASVVRQLLDAGAQVHVKDSQGNTALSIAQRYGYKTIPTMLREAGADR